MTRRPYVYNLDDRELTVLRLLANGYQDKDIAEQLDVAHTSAAAIVLHLRYKLLAHNRAHAVAIGFAAGLLNPGDVASPVLGGNG